MMRGLCILFSVLLVLIVIAGIALYIDPGNNSDTVEDVHDDVTKNVTSDDKIESVTEISEVKNVTELNSTEDITSTVKDTSEEASSNTVEATKVVDINNVESWSSSMAGIDGGLERSTRGRDSSYAILLTTHI